MKLIARIDCWQRDNAILELANVVMIYSISIQKLPVYFFASVHFGVDIILISSMI